MKSSQTQRLDKDVTALRDFLRENFRYNYETGEFLKVVYTGGGKKYKIGREAGHSRPDGYRSISCKKQRVLTHVAIWVYVTGNYPDGFIDHINGIKSDNRFLNLRVVNKSENGLNRTKQANNKTGFKGVCFDKAKNKFLAQTKAFGKKFHIGRFKTAEEASAAYEEFCKKLHGEFYYKNNLKAAA